MPTTKSTWRGWRHPGPWQGSGNTVVCNCKPSVYKHEFYEFLEKERRDSTAGSALNNTTARFVKVLPRSAEALVSVVATPYMFTQTHRVNTHLNILKKQNKTKNNSNQTKTWSRNEIQAAKIKYIMGGSNCYAERNRVEIPEIFASCGFNWNQIERDGENIFLYNKHICI